MIPILLLKRVFLGVLCVLARVSFEGFKDLISQSRKERQESQNLFQIENAHMFTKSSFPSASIGNPGVEPMDPRIREDDELAGEYSMRG